ncbi:MAG: hypothetical protein A3F67_05740 [Verrucomicrobia bacterium RIFCSPHIGHO2_12_FULL_41_10]|nr:MAG: hypothetical protein A3F67_05740 [Verrucomicrobia bacterium RIFCSPHIGHO2_12_FULL_41_10]
MDLENILSNENTLFILKIILTVGGLWFATIFLIPRGIVFYTKWQKHSELKYLSSAVSYISGGIFILIYFLAIFIASSWKC